MMWKTLLIGYVSIHGLAVAFHHNETWIELIKNRITSIRSISSIKQIEYESNTTVGERQLDLIEALSRFANIDLNSNVSFNVQPTIHGYDPDLRIESTEKIQIAEYSLWRYSPLWTIVLCIAYFIIFFLGLVGNLSVLWVIFILRRNNRHSMFATCNKVFNGLIGNLALADLLVIIFCLPATLISNIFTPYFLGRFVCKAVQYFQGVSVSASIYTLVAISIDRFYGIYYPFNSGFSQMMRRTVITFIWFLSFFIAIPWILFFDIRSVEITYEQWPEYNHTILMCQEVWPDEFLPDLYFLVVNLGLQYLVPLSIILVFYVLLMLKIWRRKIPMFHASCQRETSTDTVDQWNARIVEQSKMKVLKMLIVIVSLFALSWLPLYIIFLHLKFGHYDENSTFDNLVVSITPMAQWLGASNSCVNPILYFFFNAKFRSYLKKAITRSLLCSSSIELSRNHIFYQHYPQHQQQANLQLQQQNYQSFNINFNDNGDEIIKSPSNRIDSNQLNKNNLNNSPANITKIMNGTVHSSIEKCKKPIDIDEDDNDDDDDGTLSINLDNPIQSPLRLKVPATMVGRCSNVPEHVKLQLQLQHHQPKNGMTNVNDCNRFIVRDEVDSDENEDDEDDDFEDDDDDGCGGYEGEDHSDSDSDSDDDESNQTNGNLVNNNHNLLVADGNYNQMRTMNKTEEWKTNYAKEQPKQQIRPVQYDIHSSLRPTFSRETQV